MRGAQSGGHGMGSRVINKVDPGATGCGYEETDIALGMATRVAYDFAALGWPQLLRDGGFYALADDEATAFGADFFIEYHMNASTSNLANGVEVFVGTNAAQREYLLATNVVLGISRASGLKNRGVKSEGFAVLRQHPMDSILIELAFITNPKDVAAYQENVDAIELAIVNAVLKTYGYKQVPSLPRKWSALRRGWAKLVTYNA